MMGIQRVLFPTDFSPVSGGALPYAVHIAHTHGAELHLLHVNLQDEDDPYVVGQSVAESDRQRSVTDEWAAEQLERIASGPAFEGLRVFRKMSWDVCAAGRIAEYVGEQGVDLVVMGTHGSRGVRKWLVGSVASEVIKTAPCSVLTIPFRDEPPRKPSFRKILAPIDFSDFSRAGLSVAVELTLGYGAQLELLHVEGNKRRSSDHPMGPTMEVGTETGSHFEAETAMARFFRKVGGRLGITPGMNVREGNPGREISLFAEDRGCDLVVMGSLGLTGIDRFLMGSTAERVVADALCPVLVVRPQGRSLLVAEQR